MKFNQLSLAVALGLVLGGGSAVSAENAKPSGNPDFSPVTKAVDVNRDGKLSRDEWNAQGLPTSSFNMFEAGRGYVTQKDYEDNAAPDGIDLNGDGKLTVAEFKEFDAKMAPAMGGGQGAPGAAPQGGPGAAPDNRPTISDGERALATVRVQNLMSKHEYYHAASFNLQEVDDLWVSENGQYGKTAAFFSPSWVMQGIATIKKAYGHQHASDVQTAFKDLQKVYPELQGIDPAKADIGGEFAMHTSTTPIIEVAGDGQTAKGYFYSPGVGLVPHADSQSVQVGAIFFWEKYAADFVKENGEWKIWHLGMSYDFTPSFPESMTARLGKGTPAPVQAGPGGPGGGGAPPQQDNREKGEKMTAEEIAAGGMLPQPYPYESWTPVRKNVIDPIFPEPYYTFSETFSYGPYDENNYHNEKFRKDYNKLYYQSLEK